MKELVLSWEIRIIGCRLVVSKKIVVVDKLEYYWGIFVKRRGF